MGKIYVDLEPKLDDKMRKKIGKEGFKKGAIKQYIEGLIRRDLDE